MRCLSPSRNCCLRKIYFSQLHIIKIGWSQCCRRLKKVWSNDCLNVLNKFLSMKAYFFKYSFLIVNYIIKIKSEIRYKMEPYRVLVKWRHRRLFLISSKIIISSSRFRNQNAVPWLAIIFYQLVKYNSWQNLWLNSMLKDRKFVYIPFGEIIIGTDHIKGIRFILSVFNWIRDFLIIIVKF